MGGQYRALTLLLLPLLLEASAAEAQPPGDTELDAEALFRQGVTAYDSGDYAGALDAFEASYRARPVATVLYNIAVTQDLLGRHAQAARAFQRYLTEATTMTPERRAETAARLDQLRARLARLAIRAEPAGTEVRVDGEVVGVAPLPGSITLDPGEHTIELVLEGHHFEPMTVTLPAGFEQTISLRMRQARSVLEPVRSQDPPLRPPPRREQDDDEGGSIFSSPAFWIVAGVVIAGAGAASWYVLRDDRESNTFNVMWGVR